MKEELTSREFLRQVIKLYHSARKPKFLSKKISRGRSHSISSAVEDLFAYYLAGNIKCDRIYTDQPISVPGFDRQIYPDLVIVRNNRIAAFIDLKMDMGWNRRGLYVLGKKHYDKIDKIRGKKCKLKEGSGKKEHFYKVNKKATYSIVLVSNQNIGQDSLQDQIKKFHNEFYPDVEFFVLTENGHPNTYGTKIKDLMEKIKINEDAFRRLIRKINK